MDTGSVASVYGAFLSALAIWGWFELAFLCGIITGPNVRPCPPDIPRWERFVRAWGTIAHSEMALIATAVVMVALCWEAPNAFGALDLPRAVLRPDQRQAERLSSASRTSTSSSCRRRCAIWQATSASAR